MPITGRTTIDQPFITGFWFVAAQLGASEYQLAAVTKSRAREIHAVNKDTGQLLAFPYHDLRGHTPMSLPEVEQLWAKWQAQNKSVADLTAMTLHSFRELIDPWLKHAR